MLKKFAVVTALSTASFAFAGGWAQEPTSFTGITLGKTFEESGIKQCPAGTSFLDVYKFKGEDRCYVKSGKYSYIGDFPFDFASSFGMVAHREDGGVSLISLDFPSDKYAEFFEILIERYGKPTSSNINQVANKIGGRFDNYSAAWDGDKVQITVSQRFARIDKGSLTIMLRSAMIEDAQKRKIDAKEAASKL